MAGNPQQDLEDFASGIGPGVFSPQQGSVLPPAAQGGLAFGAASPTPPRAPVPAPSFQQAPLLQLGGQASDLNQMLAQRLQTIAGFNPATARGRDEDAYAYAMAELPKLQALAATKSQDRQLQQKYMVDLGNTLKEFNGLSLDQQNAQRSLFERLLTAHGQLAGLNAPPESVKEALSTPDISKSYADIFNDALIDPQNAVSRIGLAKDSTQRENVRALIRKESEQKALTLVQQHLPQIAAQSGATPERLIDARDLATNPQVQEYFKKSPTLERVFNDFISNKANAETLAGWGIKPGTIALKKAEQAAQGPELTGEVKDVLAGIKGSDGKPLTPATVAALPNGPAIIAAAKEQVFKNKLDISKAQGYSAVVEKAAGERNIPLIQVQGMQNVHLINKDTEMPVDRILTTLDMLQKGGGEEKFAALNDKSNEAFVSAKEADLILGQYLDISKNLTTTPGANFGQALAFYAKTKLGVENPGVAFDALQGTLLRVARAMQGSSSQLSNLDVKSIGGMLPSITDTAPTALKRLEISARIVQNMKDVQLGKMPPQKLLDQIESAKHEVAHMTGVDIYKDAKGQTIAIPRGQSHPGKGWTKQ